MLSTYIGNKAKRKTGGGMEGMYGEVRMSTEMYGDGQPAEPNHQKKSKTPVKLLPQGFCKAFSKAFFALHYGQSRALLALLAQSHT